MIPEIPNVPDRSSLGRAVTQIIDRMFVRMAASGFDVTLSECKILGFPRIDIVIRDKQTGEEFYLAHPITDISAADVKVPDDLSGLIDLRDEPEDDA